MARDIKKLHPELQKIIPKFIAACKKAGFIIQITECVRSAAEQDVLYAQGRTTGIKGHTVTNSRGRNYSSLHQWGVAFDIILNMDIDGDGKTADDIYNDSKGTFTKIGQIGKKYGLDWGGDFRSIHDSPHFQMSKYSPDKTAAYLKRRYVTPERFMNSWK